MKDERRFGILRVSRGGYYDDYKTKDFGFIDLLEQKSFPNSEIFVHRSKIQGFNWSDADGAKVSFWTKNGDRGTRAVGVRLDSKGFDLKAKEMQDAKIEADRKESELKDRFKSRIAAWADNLDLKHKSIEHKLKLIQRLGKLPYYAKPDLYYSLSSATKSRLSAIQGKFEKKVHSHLDSLSLTGEEMVDYIEKRNLPKWTTTQHLKDAKAYAGVEYLSKTMPNDDFYAQDLITKKQKWFERLVNEYKNIGSGVSWTPEHRALLEDILRYFKPGMTVGKAHAASWGAVIADKRTYSAVVLRKAISNLHKGLIALTPEEKEKLAAFEDKNAEWLRALGVAESAIARFRKQGMLAAVDFKSLDFEKISKYTKIKRELKKVRDGEIPTASKVKLDSIVGNGGQSMGVIIRNARAKGESEEYVNSEIKKVYPDFKYYKLNPVRHQSGIYYDHTYLYSSADERIMHCGKHRNNRYVLED